MAGKGRPRYEITPELLKRVKRLAAQGLTQQQIADSLGWHLATLIDKKNNYSDFSEAIKLGQASGISDVSNALFNNAVNGDNAAAIFYLKARAGWRDNHAIDHTSSDGSMSPQKVTDDELKEQLIELGIDAD